MSQPSPFRPRTHVEPTVVERSIANDSLRPGPAEQHEEVHTLNPSGVERHERIVQDPTGVIHQERQVENHGAERLFALARATQLVWLIVSAIDGLIALRVVLKLLAANPANSFASFIYAVSAIFLGPFFGLTGTPQAGQMVLEISSLIAMAIYALVGWIVVKLLWVLFLPSTARSQSTYDRYRG